MKQIIPVIAITILVGVTAYITLHLPATSPEPCLSHVECIESCEEVIDEVYVLCEKRTIEAVEECALACKP